MAGLLAHDGLALRDGSMAMKMSEVLVDPELLEHLKRFELHQDHIAALSTILACAHCQELLALIIKRELVKSGIPEDLL